MTKIKKTNYSLLFIIFCSLFIVYCLLLTVPAQSQTSEIGVTLTWSTDTYVPLDYPGKALPTEKNTVEVVATIDSPQINSEEVIYNWFFDGQILEGSSGQGRQVFIFNLGRNVSNKGTVKVEIENTEGVLLGESPSLLIKAYQPQVTFRTEALSLKNFNLVQKYQISANQEIKFIAQPYFFNIEDTDGLNYKWILDGTATRQISQDNPHTLVLKIGQVSESIKKRLRVEIENKNNPIQRAQATAEIVLVP